MTASASNGGSEPEAGWYKNLFQSAYNAVGFRNPVQPNLGDGAANTAGGAAAVDSARIVMKRLGYSQAQLDIVGNAVARMQGVGNPHTAAKIVSGDAVLDLGSGLGVDALIAAAAAGDVGRVVGLEISEAEVAAAEALRLNQKAETVSYVVGDMEQIPADDHSFDVVISNGGFCLVPDKPKAFREIARVLKPGGRVSICCTTNRVDLSAVGDGQVEWPACMEVFMPLHEAKSIVEAAGLVDVVVDDSDSKMDVWEVDEDAMATEIAAAADDGACSHARKAAARRLQELQELQDARSAERVGVHWGDPKFDHLLQRDVNKLCARVNIIARKPTLTASAASTAEEGSASFSEGNLVGYPLAAAAAVVVGALAFRARRVVRFRM